MAAIVVAWLLAYFGGRSRESGADLTVYLNPWGGNPVVVFYERAFGCETVYGIGRPGTYLGNHRDTVKAYAGEPWWPRRATTFEDGDYAIRSGWPLPCVSAERRTFLVWVGDEGEWRESRIWGLGWRDPKSNGTSVTLPLRPIWGGLVFDTFFYGGLLFAVRCGIRRVGGRRRLCQGFCPECTYPLMPSGLCPECGITATRGQR